MIIVFSIVIHSAHFFVVEDLRVFESYICDLKGKRSMKNEKNVMLGRYSTIYVVICND